MGVNRGYTVTTGIWARGILGAEYGVDLNSIIWAATDDEHVAEFEAPDNVDYSNQGTSIVELLAGGNIEAGVGALPAYVSGIERLFSDPLAASKAYYTKTGVYPINHTIVVKDAVLNDSPEIAKILFQAFKASKDAYLARLDAKTAIEPADETAIAIAQIVGDPFPFGVEPNRRALKTVIEFALGQDVISERASIDDLFAAGTSDLV